MSVRKRGEGLGATNGSVGQDEKRHDARTDLTRWRLKDDRGRQTWHYLETDEQLKAWPLSVADRYFLGLDTVS
jgi:lanosterol synthase